MFGFGLGGYLYLEMQADTDLLRLYSDSQDESAFAELVKRHLDGVYSAALRRLAGDTHLAEDVAQKVFVELARQSQQLRFHPVLSGWLYTATRNHAAKAVRTEQRRRLREKEAHAMNEIFQARSNPPDEWEKIAPVLDSAIDQLNEQDRRAVLLRFIEHKSFAEIGTLLHVSHDAARMRVDRALEKLRLHLTRRGVISPAVALGTALANHAVTAAPASLSTAITAAAIATAPLTLGALATALHLMTTSKLIGGAAAAALVLTALGTMGYQLHASHLAEEELTQETEQHDQLTVTLADLQRRVQTSDTVIRDLESKLTGQESAAARHEAESQPAPARPDPKTLANAFLLRHPEVKPALIDWMKRTEDAQWGSLWAARRFTPAQIEEFRSLMRESNFFGRTLDSTNNDYALFSVSSGLSIEEVNRRLQALLGEEGMQQYFETRTQQPLREKTAKAAAALFFSEAPMTSEQAGQFIDTLGKHRTIDSTGSHYNWDDVVKDAKQFLAPSQVAVVDMLRDEGELQKAYQARSSAPTVATTSPKTDPAH